LKIISQYCYVKTAFIQACCIEFESDHHTHVVQNDHIINWNKCKMLAFENTA